MNYAEFCKSHKLTMSAERTSENKGRQTFNLTIRKRGKALPFVLTYHMGPGQPTLVDVIECIASDAQSFENTHQVGLLEHFASFAAEYGYENLQEAVKVFTAVKAQYGLAKRFFGGAALKTLINIQPE